MKTRNIAAIAAASLLPVMAFAQTPPTPPTPPSPPNAPIPPVPPAVGRDRGPKVPVTWLGVETSEVPNVVSEQLGLSKGFGVVVDYVVPNGPAAAAGLQPNDIVKMLNDQILTGPGQLTKLVRSFAEGTTVTLTVLRKGAEQKLQVKLAKREVPQRGGIFGPDFMRRGPDDHDTGMLGGDIGNTVREQLREQFANVDVDSVREAVMEARREAMRANREAQREAAQAQREAARELRMVNRDARGIHTTRIDLGKAQVVFSDDKGEIRVEHMDGKKVLTAKDPQGQLLFSGPVDTKEDLDKVPAEVRERYEKLQTKELPNVASPSNSYTFHSHGDDNDNDNDADDDGDDDDDNSSNPERASLQQISFPQPSVQMLRYVVI